MRFGIGVVFALIVLMGADAPKNEKTPSGASLDGAWWLSSGEADGEALSATQLKGGKLVIRGARYTVTLPNIGTVTGIQQLGTTQNFKTIDIQDNSGPTKANLSWHLRTQGERVPRGVCFIRKALARRSLKPYRKAANGCTFGNALRNRRVAQPCMTNSKRRGSFLAALLAFDRRVPRSRWRRRPSVGNT